MGLLPERALTSGSIRFDGQDWSACPMSAALRRLPAIASAWIFRPMARPLNPVHTVGHQVAEPLILHRGATARAALRQAIELLEQVGIADAARRAGATTSFPAASASASPMPWRWPAANCSLPMNRPRPGHHHPGGQVPGPDADLVRARHGAAAGLRMTWA